MVNLRDNILNNQIVYYNGLIAKHSQNVEIYLNQPVGIGEHSDVMAAIDGEIAAIAQAHEKIEIINHYFLGRWYLHHTLRYIIYQVRGKSNHLYSMVTGTQS